MNTRRVTPLALICVITALMIPATAACLSGACLAQRAAATAAASPNGCSGSGGTIQPCSPQAVGESTMGRIAVAQGGPQQTVIWQVKASRPLGVYVTTIAIGAITIYGPNTQDYPPHGSFPTGNPAGLPSGAIFRINGTFSPPQDDPEEFYFQCLLA